MTGSFIYLLIISVNVTQMKHVKKKKKQTVLSVHLCCCPVYKGALFTLCMIDKDKKITIRQADGAITQNKRPY